MVACAYSSIYSGGWDRRITWVWGSQGCSELWSCHCPPLSKRLRPHLRKNKRKRKKFEAIQSHIPDDKETASLFYSCRILPVSLLLPFLLLCSPVWLPTSLWPSPKSKAQVPQVMAVQISTLKECSELSVELQVEDMEKSCMWTTSGRQVG